MKRRSQVTKENFILDMTAHLVRHGIEDSFFKTVRFVLLFPDVVKERTPWEAAQAWMQAEIEAAAASNEDV